VLILPQLDAEGLYHEFRLDEPWDSPHNRPLLARMPSFFAAPGMEGREYDPDTTYYQLVTGPRTPFAGTEGPRMPDDIPGGTANTLLLVEAADPVPWTKPADLVYEPGGPLPAVGGIFRGGGRFSLLGENRAKGFNAARVDGSVTFMFGETDEANLGRLIRGEGDD
jgi:hypothetical protein